MWTRRNLEHEEELLTGAAGLWTQFDHRAQRSVGTSLVFGWGGGEETTQVITGVLRGAGLRLTLLPYLHSGELSWKCSSIL